MISYVVMWQILISPNILNNRTDLSEKAKEKTKIKNLLGDILNKTGYQVISTNLIIRLNCPKPQNNGLIGNRMIYI